jgi:hypothetical protein
MSKIDTSKVDNVEVDGIDHKDYPDFVDAYIASADYNGIPMTEDQLTELNENYDFLYEAVTNSLF